jgi:hypothetical protein
LPVFPAAAVAFAGLILASPYVCEFILTTKERLEMGAREKGGGRMKWKMTARRSTEVTLNA